MNLRETRYSFDEELAELMELNGYSVAKAGTSNGSAEMIATKTDEVGQKVVYVILYKNDANPIEGIDVDEAMRIQKKHPGGIAVVASATLSFTESAEDMAKRSGIRLWGRAEIENLRRNVALRRNLRGRGPVEKANNGVNSEKRKLSKKFIFILIVLSIYLVYISYADFGPFLDQIALLEEQIEQNVIRDANLQSTYETAYDRIEDLIAEIKRNVEILAVGVSH